MEMEGSSEETTPREDDGGFKNTWRWWYDRIPGLGKHCRATIPLLITANMIVGFDPGLCTPRAQYAAKR